jgi:hypothetical protein
VKLTSSREEQEAKNRARQNKILKYIYKKKKKKKKKNRNEFVSNITITNLASLRNGCEDDDIVE